MENKDNLGSLCTIKWVLIFFGVVLFFWLLYIGQHLLIPFIIALLFSIFTLSLAHFFERFKYTKYISMPLAIITYLVIIYFVVVLVNSNINSIIANMPINQQRLFDLYHQAFEFFGQTPPDTIDNILEKIDFAAIFSTALTGLVSAFSNIGIILFYIVFILIESNFIKQKLEKAIKGEESYGKITQTIGKIQDETKNYFFYKTIISLATGLFCYVVMLAFGLDYASFWALLVFVLNFIPNIGSIIAVVFPVLLSLVQFTSLVPVVIMAILLTGVQFLIGNYIEPRFLSGRLNLSPLVIIVCLSFWGALWGIVGMLLSVPIMVMLNIIFSQIKSTRPLAIMLSEKGDIDS